MSRLGVIFGGGIKIRSFNSSFSVEQFLLTSLPVASSDRISKVTSVIARSSSCSSEIANGTITILVCADITNVTGK
jgi:hypothetical protein